MHKVDLSKFNYEYMAEMENLIRKFPDLYKQLNTKNTTKDFKKSDIVKCSYLQGLLKILDFNEDGTIIVTPLIDANEDTIEAISPEFLNPVKVDKSTVELLYAKND